ncbi:MAG TPA: hypothetical protein VMZ92_19640 [Planctomycetota bacterium]|nr:hypothetical protein [Planctomycetota bacterium]
MTTEERRKIKSGADPGTLVRDYNVLCCHKKVWDAANLPRETTGNLRPLLMAERRESCFFFPWTPGMSMPAAVELERAASDRGEAERDRALTRQTARAASRAAWAAIIVAATAAIIALGKLLLDWLK